MLGFGVKLASGPWVGGPPPLSHISHSFFWLHPVTFLLSWNSSSVTWSREVSSRRTGLSAPALPLRGALPRVREEQRDEAPRTTQERGSHLMAVPTAPLQDHICLELNPASNPLWPPQCPQHRVQVLSLARRGPCGLSPCFLPKFISSFRLMDPTSLSPLEIIE